MNFFSKLYITRYPLILGAIFLVGLPLGAYYNGAPSRLLRGLFDLDHGVSFFWMTLAVNLFSWSILILLRIILIYGPERMGYEKSEDEIRTIQKDSTGKVFFFIGFLLPIPLIVLSVHYSELVSALHKLLGIAGGTVVSVIVVYAADLLQRLFNAFHNGETDEFGQKDEHSGKRLLFPFDTKLARSAEESPWAKKMFELRAVSMMESALGRIPSTIGKGFLRRRKGKDKVEEVVSIFPGHILALIVFLLYFTLFSTGVILWNLDLTSDDGLRPDYHFSTITYLLLLVTAILWAISPLAFILDRYRLPVLLILLPVFLFVLKSDHYYDAPPNEASVDANSKNIQRVSPEELFRQRSGDENVIFVSAIGGGIQTSSWATEVLTRLDEKCTTSTGFKEDCRDAIALVSGVSGGSVGAMYYMETYENDHRENKEIPKETDADQRSRIKQYSRSSSLDYVGASMIFDDFPSLIPFFRTSIENDRGIHLARGWVDNMKRVDKLALTPSNRRRIPETPLREWHHSGAKRPAFVFSSTVAETGERILISSASFPKRSFDSYAAARSFEEYVGYESGDTNILIKDAVRLSAAFPLVSPASKLRYDSKAKYVIDSKELRPSALNSHLVDGGYHDNFGVLAIRDFIRMGIAGWSKPDPGAPKRVSPRIAIIQIKGEESIQPPRDCSDLNYETRNEQDEEEKQSKRDYWQRIRDKWENEMKLTYNVQLMAPLNAFWRVVWTVQDTRTEDAIREIQAGYLKERRYVFGVDFDVFTFPYRTDSKDGTKKSPGAPLSWHLTASDIKAIEDAGDVNFADAPSSEWTRLKEFLRGNGKERQVCIPGVGATSPDHTDNTKVASK